MTFVSAAHGRNDSEKQMRGGHLKNFCRMCLTFPRKGGYKLAFRFI